MVNDGGARAKWYDVEKWPSYRCKVIPARDTPMAAVTYDSPQCPFVRMGSAGQDLEANVTENCKDSFMLRTVSTNLRNKTSSLTIYLCPWNIYTVLELLKIWLHSIRSYFEALLEADITVVPGRSLSWGNVCCAHRPQYESQQAWPGSQLRRTCLGFTLAHFVESQVPGQCEILTLEQKDEWLVKWWSWLSSLFPVSLPPSFLSCTQTCIYIICTHILTYKC